MVGKEIGYYNTHRAPLGYNPAAGDAYSSINLETNIAKSFILGPADNKYLYQTWLNLRTDVWLYELAASHRGVDEMFMADMQNVVDNAFRKVRTKFDSGQVKTKFGPAKYEESTFKVLQDIYDALKSV
jgi:hypothetical protein